MLTRKIKTIKGNNELSNKRLPTLSKLKVSTEALKRKQEQESETDILRLKLKWIQNKLTKY